MTVKQIVLAGALAGMLLTQQAVSQQQSIPDAPKPQALPSLGNVAPGKGTTLTSNGDTSPAGQNPTQPQAPAQPETHPDDGPPPEVAAPGQGAKMFTLAGPTVNFVQIPFTVKDSKGQQVPGITWRDVRVYENGLRQQLSLFTSDPFPLSVALVIDQSVTFD